MNKFKTLSALNKYLAAMGKTIKENEIFEVEETGQKFMYELEERILVPLSKAPEGMDAASMSVYEVNAQIIAQQPALRPDELQERVLDINAWASHIEWCDGYFMLLCNEVRYYTMFCKPHEGKETHFLSLGEAVLRCADVVGTIHAIEILENEVEIWIKNRKSQDLNCYHLFDYSGGIATYGGLS